MLLKKVVVITDKDRYFFTATKDYLAVFNKDSGELVISDCEQPKDQPDHCESVAVFKNWLNWRNAEYSIIEE